MRALLLLLLITSTLVANPTSDRDKKDSEWVGKNVILRKSQTPFYDKNDEALGTLNRTDYFVTREQGDRIWVRDLTREGWIHKTEAILTSEAIPFLTEQINANPNESFLHAKRSKAHEHKGNYDAAIADYTEAVRLSPQWSSWVNNRGNLYLKLRRFDKAIEDYDQALALNPGSTISLNNRALANVNLREFDKAILDFGEAIKGDPTYAQARVNRANCLRELKRYDEALRDLEEAAKLDPKNASVPNQLAFIHIDRKEYDYAEEQIQKALLLDPRSSWAYHHRGNLLRARKQFREAVWMLDHGLWLEPRNVAIQTLRGVCHNELREFDAAAKDFEAVLKFDPNYAPALNGFALQLATASDDKFRDAKRATELATKLKELTKGKNPEYEATFAATLAEVGDFDSAVKTLVKAIEDTSADGEQVILWKERLAAYRQKKAWRK